MSTPRWETLGQVSPSQLLQARLLLHHAAQLVASVGRSLVPPRPDDGHTSLGWDGDLRAFVGQEVAGERAWRAGFVPERLSLVVLVDGGVARRLELAGRTREAARAWLDEQALAHGAPPGPLTFEAPYAMPPHAVGARERFAPPADGSLAEVARWFANAGLLLREVAAGWPGSAAVRAWPHHFDVGTVLPLGAGGADEAASIGVGLSPGDEGIPEPYFYVTPWPPPGAGEPLPDLAAPGRWHREGWTGAVLAGTDIVAAGDGEAQAARASAFLAETVSALRARHEQRRP
jgi:hypothetical protein